MKKYLLILVCVFISLHSHAQIKAVTQTGDEVILYEDGSWKYTNVELSESKEIAINSRKFSTPKEASFMLKSKNFNVGFWIDPKKWSFTSTTDNDEAEYELTLKGDDLYGMIITEKLEIPLETLRNIAFENASEVSLDLEIASEEYRTVNGLKVLMLQLDGSVQGIKVSYLGYYFSNSEGTLQFITYTSQKLMKAQKKTCEALLNGLVETK